MPVSSITEALDNLYTSTHKKRLKGIADQIFDGTPLWFWLRANGGLATQEGGRAIEFNISYGKSDRIKYIGKGGTVDLSDQEFISTGIEDWRYLTDSIVRFHADDQKNRGKSKVLSLLDAKITMSNESLRDQMEVDIQGAQSGLSFNGMQDLISDDPTTGTLHNIDSATNTWWRNQVDTMTGVSFGTDGQKRMRTMLNNCSKNLGNQGVDIMSTTQSIFEQYEDSILEQKRIVNKKLGDAGFENIQFKGKPLIWSPQALAEHMYFFNTNFMKFYYDPMDFFRMTDWKSIPNQVDDRAAQIITTGNLITTRRRTLGVLQGIDTV